MVAEESGAAARQSPESPAQPAEHPFADVGAVAYGVDGERRSPRAPAGHGAQALVRAGFSLGKTLHATSRALSLTAAVAGSPVKTATRVAAKTLGVPSLPVRLAVAAPVGGP